MTSSRHFFRVFLNNLNAITYYCIVAAWQSVKRDLERKANDPNAGNGL